MPKTPAKGIQSSDDRDAQALKKLRHGSQAERERELEEEAVPEHQEDDATSPIELIAREDEKKHEQELRLIQERWERDPAFRAFWNMMRRQRRESNRTLGTVADAATQAHQDVSKITKVVEDMEKFNHWMSQVDIVLKITKWAAVTAITFALGSLIVIATKIYTWGVSSGELEIRLRHIEQQMDRRQSRDSNRDMSFPSLPQLQSFSPSASGGAAGSDASAK